MPNHASSSGTGTCGDVPEKSVGPPTMGVFSFRAVEAVVGDAEAIVAKMRVCAHFENL